VSPPSTPSAIGRPNFTRPRAVARKHHSNIGIQDHKDGAMGSRRRHKQCHQETTIDDNSGINKQAGGSGMVRAVASTGNSKHQAQPLMDHFEKLLEETCPNHAFPIKHKLRDYNVMKSFMTSGSLPRSMEVDEVPDEGDTMPIPG
jgi:hypothetical protein